MPVVVVNARNLGPVLQAHFRSRRESLLQASHEVANRAVAYAVGLTNQEGLVYLSAYKRAFRVARTRGGGAELRNDTAYAAVIEWGRRPGRPGPPVAPIREWVRLKLGLVDNELESAAFLIRRAIHVRGTRPRFVMKRTYDQMKVWFKQEAERRLRAGI